MNPLPRRRILYIRHQRSYEISDAFRMNQDEWVESLSALADVTVFDHDFDLDETCDRIQPDFILYESPLFFAKSLTIANISAHPHIPRFGFLMQDPFCAIRVNFLRTLDAMNIHWIFTHLPEAVLRQAPELAPRLLSVNLLFDEKIFHDYSLEKDIPVSIFGGFMAPEIYNWRAETGRKVAARFPTLLYAHPGYANPMPRHKFAVSGEAYARLLNRSHFSLADTTRLDYPVRKHLEIPASGAVLVSPDAASLKPYGFRDMENCILGEGDALCDKIAAVADNPELYDRIRRNGHDLVHTKYARGKWRGILDFYECLKNLKPGESVQQQGFLGDFVAVPVGAGGVTRPAITASYPDSEVSSLFKKWLLAIVDKDGVQNMSTEALTIPDWLLHMEEPFVLTGILLLLKGEAEKARETLLFPQKNRLLQSGFADYDPEEMAWLSLTASLIGDSELLKLIQLQASLVQHLSLRRMRWLAECLAGRGNVSNPPADILHRADDDRLSVHWTGQLDFADWLSLVSRILVANGQAGSI